MGFAGFLMVGLAVAQAKGVPEPPTMAPRAISARASLPGTSIEVEDGDRKYTLFIPSAAKPSSEVALTIHFHSAVWHALQEHVDRGVTGPVIAFYPGEGSSIYAQSFQDPERLKRWMDRTLSELKLRGWPNDSRISAIDVTSFSAGYGAVRELVKSPSAFTLLRRVVLADSMYGSLMVGIETRTPLAEHVLVWKPLAEAAMKGEKTFAITFSQVPTPSYASSSEMASALVEALGEKFVAVSFANETEYPLLKRFDKGRFHVWGYIGEDGQAHMTHARHLADVWKALDKAGAP